MYVPLQLRKASFWGGYFHPRDHSKLIMLLLKAHDDDDKRNIELNFHQPALN
jgi:hypothetical protein